MAIVCPTVTARTIDEYQEQMERITPFAKRIHIDLADGEFTHVKLVPLGDVWWPKELEADIHVMYKRPFKLTKKLISLHPRMVVVHAEAEGDFVSFAHKLHKRRIKVGVALKPETPVSVIQPSLEVIDHVLIFSGNLGHFGGQANTHLLTKALLLKKLKPSLEIGWDGGINNQNIRVLEAGGVSVLNVGGFIQHAADAQAAYRTLEDLVG